MPNLPDLDWQPVLLVKVTREPFTGTRCGVHVSRVHMALRAGQRVGAVLHADRTHLSGVRLRPTRCAGRSTG